jgi:hypothetical protein
VFGDRLQKEFALSYLVPRLLNPLADNKTGNSPVTTGLSKADSAFLAFIELAKVPYDYTIAQFADPAIDVIAYQLSQLDDSLFRAELYFLPRETINDDYVVALWIDSRITERSDHVQGSSYFTFDFSPNQPTSHWAVNEISVATSEFTYSGSMTGLAIGFYTQDKTGIDYLPVSGSDSEVVRLPVLIDTLK